MLEKILGAMGGQAILSTMLVATCCFLWATGAVVPGELYGLTGIVVAHWLGRKGVETGANISNPAPPPVYIPGDDNA